MGLGQSLLEEYQSLYSPVSKNLQEGIHLEKSSSSCCFTDSENTSRKHTLQDDGNVYKKRRSSENLEKRESYSDDGDSSSERQLRERERNIKPRTRRASRVGTAKKKQSTHRSAVTNVDSLSSKSESSVSRSKEIALVRNDIEMKYLENGASSVMATGDPNRWVRRETVIALSDHADPKQNLQIQLANKFSKDINNKVSLFTATLETFTSSNSSTLQLAEQNPLSLTAMHQSQKTLFSGSGMIKETLIKIEKNESNSNAALGTQFVIKDRVCIDRCNTINCSKRELDRTSRHLTKFVKGKSHKKALCFMKNNGKKLSSIESLKGASATTEPSSAMSTSTLPTRSLRSYGSDYCNGSLPQGSLTFNSSSLATPLKDGRELGKCSLPKVPITKIKKAFQVRNRKCPTAVMKLFSDRLSSLSETTSPSSTVSLASTASKAKVSPQRAATADYGHNSNAKKVPSVEKCRPKTAFTAVKNTITPTFTNGKINEDRNPISDNSPVSQNSTSRPISCTEEFEKRPPSRKPIHLSPNSSLTIQTTSIPKKMIPSKNKYTISKGNLQRNHSLRAAIEKSLEMDGFLCKPPTPAVRNNLDKKQIEENSDSCKMENQISEMVNVDKNATSSTENKQNNESGIKNKRNDFSTPQVKWGHPLKNMTLAQFQSRRSSNVNKTVHLTKFPKARTAPTVNIFQIWETSKSDENISHGEGNHPTEINLKNKISVRKGGEKQPTDCSSPPQLKQTSKLKQSNKNIKQTVKTNIGEKQRLENLRYSKKK